MPTGRCAHALGLLLALPRASRAINIEGFSSGDAERGAANIADYWTERASLFTNAWGPRQGVELPLKGANWYGFESENCNYGGSWTDVPLAEYIEMLRSNGFNAIRVPLALSGCPPKSYDDLETFVRTAGDHGMLVLLSVHSMRPGVSNTNGYMGGRTGFDAMTAGWEELAKRFCNGNDFWNIMGADLMNSPHGMYWGPAPPPPIIPGPDPYEDPLPKWACKAHKEGWTECPPPPPPPRPPPVYAHYYPAERWDVIAGKLGGSVHKICPRWLIFVQGVGYCQTSYQESGCDYPSAKGQDHTLTTWWAENLQAARAYPVSLEAAHSAQKVVYCPQVHAPSQGHQDYFGDSDFPSNMPAVWDKIFGFLAKHPTNPLPVVVMEWGGSVDVGSKDSVWGHKFLEYLKGETKVPIAGSFYGAFNPDAKDYGGLLEAWKGETRNVAINQPMVDMLSQLPTVAIPTSVMLHTKPPPPPCKNCKPPAPAPSEEALKAAFARTHKPPPPPPPPRPPPPASFVSKDPLAALLLLVALAGLGYLGYGHWKGDRPLESLWGLRAPPELESSITSAPPPKSILRRAKDVVEARTADEEGDEEEATSLVGEKKEKKKGKVRMEGEVKPARKKDRRRSSPA